MAEIVLTTLNAKFIHASLGLRYLLANLGELRDRACLQEFDINQRPVDIAETLLATRPRVIGLGVYIWNVAPTTELVAIIKRVRPETIVVVGGPEVSYETDSLPIVQLADYVVSGEADLAFPQLCHRLLDGGKPGEKAITAGFPDLSQVAFPYDLYDDKDIAHRIIYVEASRGCPFSCEFCLSSLDIPVRQFPLPSLLGALDQLLARGARHLKFVDRTFNVDAKLGRPLLEFLLRRHRPGLFFHFEVIPDRFPESMKEIIAEFPAGALQFEAGVQTFNEQAAERIHRRQDYPRTEKNLRFLRAHTGVHLHADLIFGLPGESLDSFASGFDRLVGLGPQEIQVGMLKRLRGAPIARHDQEWGMVYNSHPPYEILRNSLLDFATVQQLRRFARYWDLVANSGNFVETTPLLWSSAVRAENEPELVSPFHRFMRLSGWLYLKLRRTDSIALARLAELVFEFLTAQMGLERAQVSDAMRRDFQRAGQRNLPGFLQEDLPARCQPPRKPSTDTAIPKRQARHLH